jgi:CubicO group peptidase (beta-lactamase class C family)
VEQAAREEIAKLNVPGASIAIVRGGEVVFAKGVGVANVETGEPVRPEMLFRLGSTTKMLTATALVGLAVAGKLDLNAPIGGYISGLPPRLSRITANQLLSHTAGIHDEAPMYGPHDDAALGNGIRAWTDGWLFTEPGKIFSYANPGYWMAGYLVEVLSGKPYADAMEARVFQPLGMTRTTLRPTVAMTYPLAQGHAPAGPAKCVVARPAADNAASWPAGSIFSNTADLARFVIAFMNDGREGGKQVLDPKVIALMSAPHAAYPDSNNAYGYGLELTELRGVRTLEHGGSRMGYGSFIRMAPEQRVAVIVETNRTGANLPATAGKAMELLLPLGPKAAPKTPAALEVTPEDLSRHPGVYQNGDQRLEVIAKEKRLFLKLGRMSEMPLVKRGGARFSPENGSPEYIMVAGPAGRTEYLNAGSRSFARVQ